MKKRLIPFVKWSSILAWKIEFAESAEKQLTTLDKKTVRAIFRYLKKLVASDPRSQGVILKGRCSW